MSREKSLDLGLKFLHDALDLESLHFGLFTDALSRDLEGIREAQLEYTRVLTGLIPDGVSSVLDVGCGVGRTSKLLKGKGCAVEGLSPDPFHGERFRETCGPDVPFHLSTFEAFAPARRYDCLLFSESPQYIEKDAFFPKAVELARPDGCLVAADFFQLEPTEDYNMCFVESDFTARAERAGFRVAYHRDITEEVIPNLEISLRFLSYGQRFFRFALDSARRRSRILWRLVRMLYGRKIEGVRSLIEEKLPRRLDPERFRRTMRYAMYRFER